jgi:hypothetical protein
MLRKKIGTFTQIFGTQGQIPKFLLQTIFENKDFEPKGSTTLTEKDLKELLPNMEIKKHLQVIQIKYSQNNFVVSFGEMRKSKGDSGRFVGFIKTILTFATDLKTFDVYDTEY